MKLIGKVFIIRSVNIFNRMATIISTNTRVLYSSICVIEYEIVCEYFCPWYEIARNTDRQYVFFWFPYFKLGATIMRFNCRWSTQTFAKMSALWRATVPNGNIHQINCWQLKWLYIIRSQNALGKHIYKGYILAWWVL